MKAYTKPLVQTFSIFAHDLLAASSHVKTGDSVSKTVSTGDQKTREGHGIGAGLWEDMK